jgi:hypothetical protein
MIVRQILILFTAIFVSVGVAQLSHAHHSFAASFIKKEIVKEGVVDRYVFRNPHVIVYMLVSDANGEETKWMVEGPSATALRKAGWSNKTLKPGDLLRITGNAGRNDKPMISLENAEILDPETRVVLATPGRHNFNAGSETAPADIVSIPQNLDDHRPNLGGNWGRGRGKPSFLSHRAPPFNEVGEALQASWDPAEDPQVACEDPTLIRQAGFTPHTVRIEQFDDRVVLSYEEYGGIRTIYLDNRNVGKPGDPLVKLGRSVGRYEDGKLIIESTHIPAGPSGSYGNQLSNQVTTVETYRRLDDPTQGPMVEMEMTINDPVNLYEPWEMVWKKLYKEDYEFIPVECHAPY